MKNFRDLKVWQRAHELVLDTYRVTLDFPVEERFGLTAQLRRSATSIASNIAEGCGRGTDADFARFVQMATGSASEVEYQFLLAHDLKYIDRAPYDDLLNRVVEVRRMLIALLQTLKAHSS